MAVIDGMTFDQLMDFEDSHSISLGNAVPEDTVSTTETKSVTDAVEGSESTEEQLDVEVARFANVQGGTRVGRRAVVCEPGVASAKNILKTTRVGKVVRSVAMSKENR